VSQVRNPRALRAHMPRTWPRCRRSLDERVWIRSGALPCARPEHTYCRRTSDSGHQILVGAEGAPTT